MTRIFKIIRLFFVRREVPLGAKCMALLALGYILWPMDLIPDFIPVAGWIEDFLLAALTMYWMSGTVDDVEKKSPDQRGDVIDVEATVVEEDACPKTSG